MPPRLNLGQPTREEFQAWRDHRVTRWVFRGLAVGADKNREAWVRDSWTSGQADPLKLAELRSRADAYAAPEETTYEGWCEFNGDNPLAGETD